MITGTLVLLTIGILGLMFSASMLYRNEWVYKMRAKWIDEDHDTRVIEIDNGLPLTAWRVDQVSYGTMLYRFWIWDESKFLE